MMKFVDLNNRIFADMDNERIMDNIIGLTKNNLVKKFDNSNVLIKEGDYLYLYMDAGDDDYCVSEGIVIKNPIKNKPYKFCCVLNDKISYWSDYKKLSDLM